MPLDMTHTQLPSGHATATLATPIGIRDLSSIKLGGSLVEDWQQLVGFVR